MFAPALLAAAWAVHDPGRGDRARAERRTAPPPTRTFATSPASGSPRRRRSPARSTRTTSRSRSRRSPAGLLLGVGTLAMLAYNGLLLGALAGLTIQAGTFSVFVRYIVPHGMLELSCISIAGVAGLRLARALIDPGVRPRGEALRARCARRGADGARHGAVARAGRSDRGLRHAQGPARAGRRWRSAACSRRSSGLWCLTRGRHSRARAFARR